MVRKNVCERFSQKNDDLLDIDITARAPCPVKSQFAIHNGIFKKFLEKILPVIWTREEFAASIPLILKAAPDTTNQ